MLFIKRNKSWLLLIGVLIGGVGYLLFHAPKYSNLSTRPWFFNEQCYFVPLKITQFSSCNIPQIDVQIEDQTFVADVDLGFEGGVTLPEGMIAALKNKQFVKKDLFFGVRGRTYESDVYELPKIRIGELSIFPVPAAEESSEFLKDATLREKKGEISSDNDSGKLGLYVFKSFNLLLDCTHFFLAACDSLDTLRKQGCSISTFVEAPLLLDRHSVDFEVVTQAGPLRCVLDTGCTRNMLNKNVEASDQDHMLIDLAHLDGKPPEFNPENKDLLVCNLEDDWEADQFQINGTEFGPVSFVKMQSPLGLEAILGMEFIEDHLIFIDFSKKKIYFAKLPEERSLFQRAYDFTQSKLESLLQKRSSD